MTFEVLNSYIGRIFYKKKLIFNRICKANGLTLDYDLNKSEIAILQEIFEERIYSDYFPFYQKAIVVDIGGHYGYFSLFAHKNLHTDSKIYSFEPSLHNFKCLNENIRVNNINNIISHNLAIGQHDGKSNLNISLNFNHSIIPALHQNNSRDVIIKRLDQVIREHKIDKIDFLKIDCEGSEYDILDSLTSESFEKINVISLEFHDLKSTIYTADYIISVLNKAGFSIMKFCYSKTYRGLNFGKIVAKRG